MWNPFRNKRADAAEEKSAALETKMNILLDKVEFEDKKRRDEADAILAEAQQKLDEENALQEAIDEADKIKNAHKNLATERGDPWVNIIDIGFDSETLLQGTVELDWNEKFVEQLQTNGFVGATDEDVVDQWFENFCRHIMANTYEQAHSDLGEPNKETMKDGRVSYK